MSPPWLGDDVIDAARQLLGWRIESEIGGRTVVCVIDEVEAYAGEQDPASHAYRGVTKRNGVMFGPGGHLYVYRSYGIHWCMNVVVGSSGIARAVLLRGAQLLEGRETVEQRRGRSTNLMDGPGKLTQALGVDGSFDGHAVTERPLRLLPPVAAPAEVIASPRVGISKAVERPWRFVASRWDDGLKD